MAVVVKAFYQIFGDNLKQIATKGISTVLGSYVYPFKHNKVLKGLGGTVLL